MEDIKYTAHILNISDRGSILVNSEYASETGYHGDMVLHTSMTKLEDIEGNPVDVSYFKEGMWIMFITNGIMTMSLPPQLNPSFIKEIKASFESDEDDVLVSMMDDDSIINE